MILYVNEKLFSIHNKYYIKDENNKDIYEISSKAISLGAKTTIRDMKGNKIAYVEQLLFHITPHYSVYIDDELSFRIAKKFQPFKNDYILSNGYRVDGKIMMLDFTIYDDKDNKIASIKRKFFHIGDKYEIDIIDPKKINIILAIIVAIANNVDSNQSS